MRILILTFYYPPDLCAGSFRTGALVESLLPRLPAGATVDVLTTMPNRYASCGFDCKEREEIGPLTIERIPLPSHRSGMIDQARAFLAFDRSITRLIRNRSYDLVFATSSRLMTAFLGARVARRMNAPLFLDIRDIFTDTMKDVLPGVKGRLILPILNRIERFSLGRAARLNLVSEGFKDYFQSRYPTVPTHFYTNGIDEDFLSESWQGASPRTNGPIRVMYAGNIGEGQGLHKILPRLTTLAGTDYQFTVVGDGGRKEQLCAAMKEAEGPGLEFMPPVGREKLIELYREADVLFLHLNDYDAFAKVLPSKIFEYAASGRPILAGVGGFSADFLRSEVDNCGTFPPCDADAGFEALRGLELGTNPRAEFVRKYSRTAIMGKMADTLLGMAVTKASPGT